MNNFFFMLFIFLTVTTAHAQMFRGPISSSLGGAGVAGIPASEAGFLNPALVPFYKGSSLDAYYKDGYVDSGQHRQAYGVGAIDNGREVWFPGSLHYIRSRDSGRATAEANGELIHGAIGQTIAEQFSIGLSGYRVIHDVVSDRQYEQWNYSLGGLWAVSPDFGVGYVLRNLAHPASKIPAGLREDMQQSLGVLGSLGEMARVRFDIARHERHNPKHKMAYLLGLETKTSDLFVVRLGFRRDELADVNMWTAGLGFDGPRLKLDYSFEKNEERTSGALHSVDLRLPF